MTQLVLGIDKDEMRPIVSEAHSLVESFANTEDTLLVVEHRVAVEEEDVKEEAEEAGTASTGTDGGTRSEVVRVIHELPEDCLESPPGMLHHFLLLVKTRADPLTESPIAFQVLPTIVDSRSPLSSVVPFVRSAFVPLVARMVEEERSKKSLRAKKSGAAPASGVGKAAAVLDKLRELEMKLSDTDC